MTVRSLIHNKHLLWRAGFGAGINQFEDLKNKDSKTLLDELLKEETFTYINYDTPDTEIVDYMNDKSPAEKRKEIQKINRRQNEELNLNFLYKMVTGAEQLREKMAFFWHGHFASRVQNPKFNRQILNIIRKNALGNFRDL